jgi:hypothetical protein
MVSYEAGLETLLMKLPETLIDLLLDLLTRCLKGPLERLVNAPQCSTRACMRKNVATHLI